MRWDLDHQHTQLRHLGAAAAALVALSCGCAHARIILPQAVPSSTSAVMPRSGAMLVAQAPGRATPTLTPMVLAPAPRIAPELHGHIVRSAAMWQLDPYLVKAVIHAESAFRPRAVSPKSAIGLMQVLPATARQMGLQPRGGMSVTELLMNDQVSILVGTKYLAQQLQRFGQVDLALAAYNAGPEAVARAGRRVPAYAETQAYVRRVLSLYAHHRRAGSLSGVGA